MSATKPHTLSASQPGAWALDGELSIYGAAMLKEDLLDLVQKGDDLTIELSGVTEMDTAGFQVLMLTVREAVARGAHVALTDPSPAVTDLMGLYGFDELQNLDEYFQQED